MASQELISAWESYKDYYRRKGVDEKLIDACHAAAKSAFLMENDIEYGRMITAETKKYIHEIIHQQTGRGLKELEEWLEANKQKASVVNTLYDVLLLEAPYDLDSYILYIEKDRPCRERFYAPRRKTLKLISDKLQALEDDTLDELFIHMPARVGKLLADETPVFTSTGWKRHGDLVVGDKVIGSDGEYTEVVAVHPKDVADYKVTLSDGEIIYCHGNHEWTVYDKNCQRIHTYETKDMISRLTRAEYDKRYNKYRERNMMVLPHRCVMDGEEKNLRVAPYVLGAWLGDGTSSKPYITDPKKDYRIIEQIEKCGYANRKQYMHKTTGVITYVFDSKLMYDLRSYGLCNRPATRDKYIPVEYLTASKEQRLELLAGLLDTDGTLNVKEKRYSFSTTSEALKDDVVTLINTFGWRTCVVEYDPHTSSFGIVGKKKCWRISFNPSHYIPCVLERKQLHNFSKQNRIAIKSIEKCSPKIGNCITVANKDGLYAVGKTMQLTHNSQLITLYATWHCARNTEASNLYVTYKEGLGGAFLEGVQEIYTDPTYCFADVFPKVKIVATDAKNNKLDLNRRKKYKSLSGKGLESGLNGEYDAYGVLILDDILEGVQDVMSADVLRRKQIIFDNNVMMRKKQKCKIIYNGTIWATNDLYMDRLNFLETDKTVVDTRYDVIKIPALDPDTDESNFDYDYDLGYSTEYYRALRAKFEMNDDLAGWFAQCQQEPIDRTGAVFNPEHMRYYSDLPNEEPLKVIGHCDTALGGGDFVSFPVIYYYEDGSGYVEDVVFDNSEKHITQPQVVSMIKKHNMKNVHFESNQGGEAYKDDVKRMLLEDVSFNGGRPINISSSWAPVTKRKAQRIWDNAQSIRELYFKDPQHRHDQYRKFMQNLFSFSLTMKRKQHDDAADSLAGAVEFEAHGSGVRKATISKSWI